MATYTVDLSPTLVNLGTEGSLDTSVTGGNSIQRTMHGILIKDNTGNYKMVGRLADGATFTDTIENVADYPNIN
jgi:hypothetical protein